MTRHGVDPGRVAVARGCGMALIVEGRIVACDRSKWHKGGCSTKAQRRAVRSA